MSAEQIISGGNPCRAKSDPGLWILCRMETGVSRYGPFPNRDQAAECLIALAARPNVYGAEIRWGGGELLARESSPSDADLEEWKVNGVYSLSDSSEAVFIGFGPEGKLLFQPIGGQRFQDRLSLARDEMLVEDALYLRQATRADLGLSD